jgi:hypothetical protein
MRRDGSERLQLLLLLAVTGTVSQLFLFPLWTLLRIKLLCICALTGYTAGADVSALLKQGDTALAGGSYQAAVASYTEALGKRSLRVSSFLRSEACKLGHVCIP